MRRLLYRFPIAAASALLVLAIHGATPDAIARSQTAPAQAPVVLDGRVLFQVGDVGEAYPARTRAEEIAARLRAEVERPEPPRALTVIRGSCAADRPAAAPEIAEPTPDTPTGTPSQSRQASIWILCPAGSERGLLTVTPADVPPGVRARWQAEDWRQVVVTAIARAREQRQPEYLRRAVLISLGWVAIAGGIGTVAAVAAGELRRRLARLHGDRNSPWYSWVEPAELAIKGGATLLQTGVLLGAAYAISSRFPLLRQWRYQLWNWLSGPNIALSAARSYSPLQLVTLVALSAGLWVAVGGLTQLLKESVLRRSRMPVATQEVLAFFLRYTLVFLGGLILFQLWGIDLRSLTILASVLGVGIGFGVQNIANNFISGLIVAIERPIQIGDFVRVGEWTGIVKQIGARHTTLSTLDRVSVIVPNSRFLEQEVINWSHGDATSRLQVPVGVAYGSDVERVRGALLEAAKGHSEVLLRPRPTVWFEAFGDSSLDFTLLVWINAPQEMPRIKSELNFRIAASLQRHGITVPFPQRDVNLHAPQLERAIAIWLAQAAPQLTETPVSPTVPPEPAVAPLPQPNPRTEPAPGDRAEDVDLEEIVAGMRGPEGITICNRRYRLQLYPACFVGLDAVDWLVKTYNLSRPEAVAIGQIMLDRGIIHHVLDNHPFTDSYLFYRFYSDEQKLRH